VATTSDPGSFLLYGTAACHLCEQAALLLQPWLGSGWTLREVDISEDDELFERYGIRIPVLAVEGCSRELNWPFTAGDIGALVAEATGRP
jgi:hypothetical protein